MAAPRQPRRGSVIGDWPITDTRDGVPVGLSLPPQIDTGGYQDPAVAVDHTDGGGIASRVVV